MGWGGHRISHLWSMCEVFSLGNGIFHRGGWLTFWWPSCEWKTKAMRRNWFASTLAKKRKEIRLKRKLRAAWGHRHTLEVFLGLLEFSLLFVFFEWEWVFERNHLRVTIINRFFCSLFHADKKQQCQDEAREIGDRSWNSRWPRKLCFPVNDFWNYFAKLEHRTLAALVNYSNGALTGRGFSEVTWRKGLTSTLHYMSPANSLIGSSTK